MERAVKGLTHYQRKRVRAARYLFRISVAKSDERTITLEAFERALSDCNEIRWVKQTLKNWFFETPAILRALNLLEQAIEGDPPVTLDDRYAAIGSIAA